MKNRFKNYIKKLRSYGLSFLFSMMSLTMVANAKVTFNQSQATTDIKSLTDPISNVLMAAGFGITLVSIGLSFFSYMGKDDEEKQSIPFHKTVKKHVVAFIFLGFAGVILKWFSIS